MFYNVAYCLLDEYFFDFQYMQNDPPSREVLSQLIVQFIQYQETKLGKNADNPIATRLPVSFFPTQS